MLRVRATKDCEYAKVRPQRSQRERYKRGEFTNLMYVYFYVQNNF